MSITKKLEQIAAFRLEKGKTIGTGYPYGGNTLLALGTNHMFPYLNISVDGKTEFMASEDVDGIAQRDVPVLFKKNAVLDSWDGNCRFRNMGRFLYWAFGYEDGGSSPETVSAGVYRHLYELDRHERHLTSYRSDEDTAVDYASTDRKVRFGSLGLKKGTNDFRFPFLMCGGFGFGSSAGQEPMKWNAKGNAYREDRGNYASADWTAPAGATGTQYLIGHHHLTLSLGPSGALVDVAVTDFQCSVDIPLLVEQDSESGLFVAQPVLNGKYGVSVSCTLARHEADTYKAYRDAFTACCMKAVYASGADEFGLYFPNLRIIDAPDTGDEVARHPLTFAAAKEDAVIGNPFATEIGTCDLIQHGEVFCVTKDNNSANDMRRE
jgi:hypothetical protein